MVKRKGSKGRKQHGMEGIEEASSPGFVPLQAPPAKVKAVKVKSDGIRPKSRGNTRGQRTTKQKLRKNDRMQKAMSVSDKKGHKLSKSSATTQRKQQLKHLWTNQQPPPEL